MFLPATHLRLLTAASTSVLGGLPGNGNEVDAVLWRFRGSGAAFRFKTVSSRCSRYSVL